MNHMSHVLSIVTAEVATITPEMAREMLATSLGNRSLKAAKIKSLTRDMQSGKFRLNGESVIISEKGNLMDGHHRLTACAQSGVPIQTILVQGIREDAGKTQDTGAARTVGDHLALSGFVNSNNLSAIVCSLMSLANGRPRSANPSSTEVFEFIQRYPRIEAAATFSATKAFPRLGTMFGTIYFVADLNGETEIALAFREVFATGIPSYPHCPAHALRERLTRQAMRGEKLPVATIQKLFISAWEKFRVGEAAKVLKIPSDYKVTGWPE